MPGVVSVSVAGSARRSAAASKSTARKGRDIRRELAAAIVRGGWGLLELRPMRMSLEDIFLSLTTEETAARQMHPTQPVHRSTRRWPMRNILAIAQRS